jgi:hypothetical protein
MPISHSGNQQKATKTTIQIIVFSLIAGVLFFGVIAVVNSQDKVPEANPFMTYLAVGGCAMMLFMSAVVSKVVASAAIKQAVGNLSFAEDVPVEEQKQTLLNIYQIKTIIEQAMLEGPVFFALVSYMAEKNSMSLVAAIMLLTVMILKFPFSSRIDNWIEYEFEMIPMNRE